MTRSTRTTTASTTTTRPATPRLMSQAEVADYLGVTVRTVRNHVSRGDLPAFRVRGSRLLRFRAVDVNALLEPVPTVGAAR